MTNEWTNSAGSKPRILIIGLPWIEEFVEYSKNTRLFSTLNSSQYDRLLSQGWNEIIASAQDCDYLILRGDAYKLILQLNKLNLLERFMALSCSKIFWSLDSHMLHKLERKVIPYFDFFCVAHSEWIKYLKNESVLCNTKILHIPCSFNLVPTKVLRSSLSRDKRVFDLDVYFPYNFYDGSRRDALAFDVFRALKKMNVRFAFGATTGYSNNVPEKSLLFHRLTRSKVILNLSLSGELNKRVFEAYYARSKIVSNDSKDLVLFPEISSIANLYSYERSSAEFIAETTREAVHHGLCHEVANSIEHTDLNRVLQIVESITGLAADGSVEEFVSQIDCKVLNSTLKQVTYSEIELVPQWFKAMRRHRFLTFIFTKSSLFNCWDKMTLLIGIPKLKFFHIRHRLALDYYRLRKLIFQ